MEPPIEMAAVPVAAVWYERFQVDPASLFLRGLVVAARGGKLVNMSTAKSELTRAGPSDDAVLTHWTRQLVARAGLTADDRDRMCAASGVSLRALLEPRLPIPTAAVARIWAALTLDAPGGHGLLFADRIEPSALGLIGYLVAASETLIDALDRVVRYQARAKAPGSLVVTTSARSVSIVELPPSGEPPWPPALAEAALGSFVALGRKLSRAALVASNVRFQHAPPQRGADFVERWFGCAPRYRAPVNELVLERRALAQPIMTRDPVLLGYLEPLAAATGDEPEDLLRRVRTLIARELSNGERPSVASIGRLIGVAPRTLQRRLADLGWGFSALIDDVRRATAARLLTDDTLSRAELAQLLGYCDSSALSKGLRRMGLRVG